MTKNEKLEFTTRFENANETRRYLEYLNSKEIDYNNGKTGKNEKYYYFQDMIFSYDKEKKALLINGDIPKKVQKAMDNEQFKDCFDKNYILNLEGLTFIATTIIDKGIDYYNKLLYLLKHFLLYEEFAGSSYPNYEHEDPAVKTNDIVGEIRDNINKLCDLTYPVVLFRTNEYYKYFFEDNIAHSNSDKEKLEFSWKDKDNTITCYFKYQPRNKVMVINNLYDDSRSETLSYKYENDSELIEYVSLPEMEESIKFNLTSGIINNSKAKEYDYEKINRIIKSFYHSTINKLPYLKEYVDKHNKK